MKKLALVLVLLLSGCASLQKAQLMTQDISGSATVSIETFLNRTDITIENARKEDGFYVADLFELNHYGKWSQTIIRISVTDYKRLLIKDEK